MAARAAEAPSSDPLYNLARGVSGEGAVEKLASLLRSATSTYEKMDAIRPAYRRLVESRIPERAYYSTDDLINMGSNAQRWRWSQEEASEHPKQ